MDHFKKKKNYISRCKLLVGWLFFDYCYFEDKDKTIPSFPDQESPLCTPGLSFLFLSTSSFFYPLIHSSITHGIHSCFQWTSWFWKDGLRVPFLSSPSLISSFLDVSSYFSCSFIPFFHLLAWYSFLDVKFSFFCRCQHYRRRCQIRAPCCNEIFTCRHCHNEATVL